MLQPQRRIAMAKDYLSANVQKSCRRVRTNVNARQRRCSPHCVTPSLSRMRDCLSAALVIGWDTSTSKDEHVGDEKA